MKKIAYLLAIFVFLAASVSPVMAGSAADENPPQPDSTADIVKTYLPLMSTPSSFTFQGQITGAQAVGVPGSSDAELNTPLAGVTVRSSDGASVLTGADGRYTLTVRRGATITPELRGYYFSPSYVMADHGLDFDSMNFSGVNAASAADQARLGIIAAAPTAEIMPNPSFEVVPYYWNPISGNAAGFTPYYTNLRANTGVMSGFTGIPVGWTTWRESWSRWRSHEFFIPVLATQAEVSFAIWPASEEPAALPATTSADRTLPAELQALIGHNTEEAIALNVVNDFQYLAVTNINNEIIDFVWWDLRDDQAWVAVGPLSLAPFAGVSGQIVKLEFGTVNDGDGWESQAFFDDVSVMIEVGAVTCTSTTLINPDMELGIGNGWVFNPQNIPPINSNFYFWSPITSIQAGIAPWDVEPPFATTTEFYQLVTLPADATYVRLRMLVLPQSTANWGWWWSEVDEAERKAPDGAGLQNAVMAPDQTESQYAFIANTTGTQGLIKLFKFFSIDSANWLAREYNITALRGTTFSVLFGTGDTNGAIKTSLFVDDVYIDVCTPAAEASVP